MIEPDIEGFFKYLHSYLNGILLDRQLADEQLSSEERSFAEEDLLKFKAKLETRQICVTNILRKARECLLEGNEEPITESD